MKANLFIKQMLGTCLFFAVIFISAGHFCYWQGIVYVLIGIVMLVLNYTILRLDPDLLSERSKPGEGVKKWDKMILGFSFLSTIGMYVVAGLDSGRYHWSPSFHYGVYLSGMLLTALGQLIFLIAQKQNKFFSSTVRIQTDRGHTVCESGLYKIVRHPAYMGSFIQATGFPMLFGSLWSIIPVSVSIVLLLLRTYLEDHVLKDELAGYSDYALKTRFRLIPYVW
ncbi:MAG TPA: isoprenylcysteine carboxylmethyltransferase family protein [Bacteroidales bacterium]|nr:isoprenylcysteine carboxylmethyltransferase family protein [Bacteroidales bacterium]